MAINKNHEFEELDGVKCCIVERSVTAQRAEFLRTLLQGNGYSVVVSAIIPKTAAPATEGDGASPPPPAPTAFTVGVTDMAFNAINAIFGRFLRTKDGEVVTLAYWQQKSDKAEDIPYFER
jgi:hypothetical protein